MMVQRASTDIWIGDSVFDVTPTISTRFVDDSGCSICGGFDTFGSACACVMRSATTCRAVNRSVPGLEHQHDPTTGPGPTATGCP